jgi:signal transduction histidine kinase/PAS domain-containing protein
MDASSSPLSSHDLPPRQTSASGEALNQMTPSGRRARNMWLGPMRWLQQNTFAPRWLPKPLRHPLVGYAVAALLEVVAAAVILFIMYFIPSFAFRGVLTDVVVVLVALGWGAGPGLFATLVGTFLLYYAVLPPHFTWGLDDPADAIGLMMCLVIGACISVLASRSEQRRRQAEEAARRLRAVLDVMPSAVLIAGPQGQLLEMNEATRTLWGGDIALAGGVGEYAQYKAWWTATGKPVAPDEWTLARALASGVAQLNDEMEIEAQDGQRKIILNSAVPIRDATGAITGGVINAQDISALRRLEREMTERAAELQATFEAISDGIALMDAQGMLVRTNQAFRALFGLEQRPEWAAHPLYERMSALALRDEQAQPLGVGSWPCFQLLQGETLTEADTFVTTPAGHEAVVNVTGALIRDETGQITGCVQVFRDVTARRQLEQRTRDSLDALVAMGEAMAHVNVTADISHPGTAPLGDVAKPISPTVARRMAELTRDVLGCRCVSIVAVDAATELLDPVTVVGLPPEQEQVWWAGWSQPQRLDDRLGPAMAAAVRAGAPALLDARGLPEGAVDDLYQARTGLMLPMRIGEELIGLMLVDYGTQDHDYTAPDEVLLTQATARLGALVLERDRLLRQWTEARANELATRATKEQMDTFLGIASHELKTPLTAITLSLHLIERRLRTVADRQAAAGEQGERAFTQGLEQLGRTVVQVGRMDRLINDLVDVSRVQAGKLELRPERTDLAAIVREVVKEQRETASTRTISLQLPADMCVPVIADPGRIEQVVANYLTNALRYSPADRPVAVGVRIERQQARVWVRDEGPGLPPEEQERIWERFHRANGIAVQSGTGIGLGLGLHISRTIVERHHGQVGVESAPGAGSTFWFTLPLASPADEDQPALQDPVRA